MLSLRRGSLSASALHTHTCMCEYMCMHGYVCVYCVCTRVCMHRESACTGVCVYLALEKWAFPPLPMGASLHMPRFVLH